MATPWQSHGNASSAMQSPTPWRYNGTRVLISLHAQSKRHPEQSAQRPHACALDNTIKRITCHTMLQALHGQTHAHKSRDRKGNLPSPTRCTHNETQHRQDLHGQSPLEARLHHRASKHRLSKFRNQGGNQMKQIEPKSRKQRRSAFAKALAGKKAFKI